MKKALMLFFYILFVTKAYCNSDNTPFSTSIIAKFTVKTPETIDAEYDQSISINSQSALHELSQITIPVNEHFWKVKIIKAETIKKNGEHIIVGGEKVIDAELPDSPTLEGFDADIKTKTIIFPNVDIGDTIHFVVKKEQIAPNFPGSFSVVIRTSPEMRIDEYKVSLNSPDNLNIHFQNIGFKESQEIGNDHRITYRWDLPKLNYERPEPGSVSSIDTAPYLIISSANDWASISDEFFKLANSKSNPTADIKNLAETITKNIIDRKEQVRAIFDWVSTNIRYYNISLGDGGYVPHRASDIAVNKYGDCKDHVTLMRSLLKAKNIDSEYALISLDPYYKKDLLPTISWFNHVVLYIPEFDIYSDPTSLYSSFDKLLPEETAKPALKINDMNEEASISLTPAMLAEENKIISTSEFYLKNNNKLEGKQYISATGEISALLRKFSINAQQHGDEDLIKNLLNKQKIHGTGTVQNVSNSVEHADPYTLQIDLSIINHTKNSLNQNITLSDGIRPYRMPYSYLIKYHDNSYKKDFQCHSEKYVQIIRLHLPVNYKIENTNTGINIKNKYITYVSKYEVNNNIIESRRELTISFSKPTCHAEMVDNIYDDLIAIEKDFSYKPKVTIENKNSSELNNSL